MKKEILKDRIILLFLSKEAKEFIQKCKKLRNRPPIKTMDELCAFEQICFELNDEFKSFDEELQKSIEHFLNS